MFLQSVHFFENNLGQIMKVRIFWTRLVWRKQKCPDFLDKNFFAKMQKSGFFGVRILSKPLYNSNKTQNFERIFIYYKNIVYLDIEKYVAYNMSYIYRLSLGGFGDI